MATPSLILVPSKYKVGKLYTPLAINSNGVNIGASGDFNVTRSTSGTRVNAQGFIESVPLLTNFALQSQAFNVTWTQTQVSITGNTTDVLDPDGGNQADLISPSLLSSEHKVSQTTTSASGSYTLSVYARRSGYNFVYLSIGSVGAYFNLLLGTVGTTSSGIVASIQSVGNSWFRCIISKAASSANEVISLNIASADGSISFGGNGIFGVYLYGAQYETGIQAGPYIPTTTTTASNSVPRLDYYTSGGTAGCPALLVEPSAQNAFIQSQTLFTSHLVQNLTTAGYADAAVSPDGAQNAEKFVPNTTNGVHGIADITSQTITSGTTYTFSCFAKSDGGANFPLIALILDNSTAWGATRNAIFNVVSGTIHGSAPSGVTMRIQDYGSGWYRFSATATAVGSVTGQYQYRIYIPNSSAALPYAAASGNTEGVLVWGAQLEVGSIATSYIPTTTGSITRNADAINVTGAVSGCIGQTQGTIYAEVDLRNVSTGVSRRIVELSNNAAANRIIIYTSTSDSKINVVSYAGGTEQTTITTSGVITGIAKIAFAYTSNNVALYVNGSLVSGLTSYSIPACNKVNLGSSYDGASFFNDRIRAAALYNTRLSNAELASLTTL
jgi:hypothetical protein